MNGHHVDVVQTSHGLGFPEQATLRGIGCAVEALSLVSVQELDRDLAVELWIVGRVDHPHPSGAQTAQNEVPTDPAPAGEVWAHAPIGRSVLFERRGGGFRRYRIRRQAPVEYRNARSRPAPGRPPSGLMTFKDTYAGTPPHRGIDPALLPRGVRQGWSSPLGPDPRPAARADGDVLPAEGGSRAIYYADAGI